MSVIAPWDSIGFQILATWVAFIIIACWACDRVEVRARRRHEELERQRRGKWAA